MDDLYCRLYNKLQVNESCNMAFYDKNKIYVPCSFDKVVKSNLQYLIDTHKNRIAHQIEDLKLKLRVLEILEELKSSTTNIKKLVDMSYDEATDFLSTKFGVEKDIASKVLQKSISYLTKEHKQEIEDLKSNIDSLINDDRDIYEFLSTKYKNIRKDIKKQLERQAQEKSLIE